MRRFQKMPDGSITPLNIERTCLEGMIERRSAESATYNEMLSVVTRYPQLFVGKTPAEVIGYFVDMVEAFNERDNWELNEVAFEEAYSEKERLGLQESACEPTS